MEYVLYFAVLMLILPLIHYCLARSRYQFSGAIIFFLGGLFANKVFRYFVPGKPMNLFILFPLILSAIFFYDHFGSPYFGQFYERE